MLNWIRDTWCKSMHDDVMWPIHGKYVCTRCQVEYPVLWETPLPVPVRAAANVRSIREEVPYASSRRVA